VKKLSRRGKKNLRDVKVSSRNGTRSLAHLSVAHSSGAMGPSMCYCDL
jgi:hypothetical protein